jgi:hypothetical protein
MTVAVDIRAVYEGNEVADEVADEIADEIADAVGTTRCLGKRLMRWPRLPLALMNSTARATTTDPPSSRVQRR